MKHVPHHFWLQRDSEKDVEHTTDLRPSETIPTENFKNRLTPPSKGKYSMKITK